MSQHYLTAVLFMAVLTGAWLAVQRLWRRHLHQSGRRVSEDALAGHGGCHGCSCGQTGCENDDISN